MLCNAWTYVVTTEYRTHLSSEQSTISLSRSNDNIDGASERHKTTFFFDDCLH